MIKERQIGEIFYSNLAKCWVVVKEFDGRLGTYTCKGSCIYYQTAKCDIREMKSSIHCQTPQRSDKHEIIFTKIPEVTIINEHNLVEGEYFIFNNRIYKTVKYGNIKDTFIAAIPDNVTKDNILYRYTGADVNRLVFKFIQKCDNKINNMEEGIVKLTLEKAKEYYNGTNEALKEIAKQAFNEDKLKGDSWESHFINTNGCMNGFVINTIGSIVATHDTEVGIDSKRIFKTQKQALSALAYAQLTQLMALPEYNGDWQPIWDLGSIKYCIYASFHSLIIRNYHHERNFIAFKNAGIRDKFLQNFEPLLKQYFQID